MTDIFREVDEELRREQYLKLWQKYGRYLAAVAALIVLATGAIVGWRQYQDHVRTARSIDYQNAVSLAARGDDGAAAAFAKIGAGEDGYGSLARLREAALAARQGDRQGALAVYEKLADDARVDPLFRQAATILYAELALAGDRAEPDRASLDTRLMPLMAPGNPWRLVASELAALNALKAGDTARARALYQAVADEASAPAGMRARAAEMLAAIGK